MSIQLFRDELVTALSTISGLNVYKQWPSVIVAPYVVVSINPDNPLSYHQPAKGNCTYHLFVEVGVLKAATFESAQEALDPYIEPDGTSSIYAKLVAGVYTHVDVIDVPGISAYGEVTYGSSQYLGARFNVDAWRSGL
jgi:hypothetical protein